MPNNVKVLLVDDNPMVLELLHGALKPLAAVTTSSDTADALLKAVDTRPPSASNWSSIKADCSNGS
jgi:CheY-like chemotaxis protein